MHEEKTVGEAWTSLRRHQASSKERPLFAESQVAPRSHDCRYDHVHYHDEYIQLKDTSCWRTISRGPSKDRDAVKDFKAPLSLDKTSSASSRGALELKIDRIDVDVSIWHILYFRVRG